VFKRAIQESAYGIILVHNHPSGDPSPSENDIEVTEKLIEVGELLGVKVIDHVIVGREELWSWRNKDLKANISIS
jgi:DNA repair protein RadC